MTLNLLMQIFFVSTQLEIDPQLLQMAMVTKEGGSFSAKRGRVVFGFFDLKNFLGRGSIIFHLFFSRFSVCVKESSLILSFWLDKSCSKGRNISLSFFF